MSEEIIERDGISMSVSTNRNGVVCVSAMLGDQRLKQLYMHSDSKDECIADFVKLYKSKASTVTGDDENYL